MSRRAPDFALQNLGAGPDPFALPTLPDDVAFVVLYFQRDDHCTNCRSQVQAVADRYEAFVERDAEVASIVPEPADTVREWQDRYDLPFALLADPNATVGAAYDQPVRFGILGRVSDFFGRMPQVVVVDRRGDEPVIAHVHRGSSTFDRPSVDDVLAELDRLRGDEG